MIKGLLKLFIEDKGVSLQQFRMGLIKTGVEIIEEFD
jgi:hypothetical protein